MEHSFNQNQLQYKNNIKQYKRNQQFNKRMWQSVLNLCPNLAQPTSLITIQEQETYNQHSDILTVSYMLHLLQNNDKNKVIFIGFRENYAHYLAISKKMGKSIETYLRQNKNLFYYEQFMDQYCEQLPLADSSPATYIQPPKNVKVFNSTSKMIHQISEQIQEIKKEENSDIYVIVDSLAFIEHQPLLCYELYQKIVGKQCTLFMAGCSAHSAVSKIIRSYSLSQILIQNDVGGYGRIKICCTSQQKSLLWRWAAGKIEVEAFVKL